MATHELLSATQRRQFNNFYEETISERDLARFYTFSPEELELINQHRRSHNRLGFAVQWCYLRYPGRPLRQDELVAAPLLQFVATQLQLDPTLIDAYLSGRETTRREHLRELQRRFGYSSYNQNVAKSLREVGLTVALQTDKPVAVIVALMEELRHRKVLLPALSTLENLAWQIAQTAQTQIFQTLMAGLTAQQRESLDNLLRLPPESLEQQELREEATAAESTADESPSVEETIQAARRQNIRLTWLRQPASKASPVNFLRLAERLELIRALGLDKSVTKNVHQNWLLLLAREGAKFSPQRFGELSTPRRYATLVAFLLEYAEQLTDQALLMHDRMIGQLFNLSERRQNQDFLRSGKAINEKVRLYAQVGQVFIDAKENQTNPYTSLAEIISWDRFVSSVEEALRLSRPADFDFLDLFANRYSLLRRYTPKLLALFEFKGAASAQSLLVGLEVIRALNALDTAEAEVGTGAVSNESKKRALLQAAPTDFVKSRWIDYVYTEAGTVDRTYYELCCLAELRGLLRSGDVWVEGSRQYKALEDYLITPSQWQEMRQTNSIPLPINLDCNAYLEERLELLDSQLVKVNDALAEEKLTGVRIEKEELVISPLQRLVPAEAETLSKQLYRLIPRIKLTSLLVEVDGWTNFSRAFTHLQTEQIATDKEALLAAVLADGINLGLTKMELASPNLTERRMSYAADWHIRDETYARALAEVVNFQHNFPFATNFGSGTTSSSDGQHFRIGGQRELNAQTNAKYGRDPVVVFYTHVSDQQMPFYVKVLSGEMKEAAFLLDGLLYHQSELNIHEHYTDTAGYTDHIFAATHLLGFRFAPRLRDFPNRRLHSFERASDYPALEPLIGETINIKHIRQEWDDVLRLMSSIAKGTVTASLMLRKLAAYPRQNRTAWALRELGRIEKSLFMLDWMQDPELRRQVQIGLNKGESRQSLSRAVFLHRLGEVRDRAYEDQSHRASGLTLLTACISLWNTVYLAKAVETLTAQGTEINSDLLHHLSPIAWDHIGLTGDYNWNLQDTTTLTQLRTLRNLPAPKGAKTK